MSRSRAARYAWNSLLLVALIPLALGFKGLMSGMPLNPAVIQAVTGADWGQLQLEQPGVARLVKLLVRHESLVLLAWGFWLVWSVIHAPRTAGKWAWTGWWTVPILTVGVMLTSSGRGGPFRLMMMAVTMFSVVALLLSRGLFDSSKPQ